VLGSGVVGDVVVARDRLTPGGDDFVHDRLGRRRVGSLPGERAAEVVDDHLGAGLGQGERVLAADAAARAGHDRHLPVERRHARGS
jgi:hypothetical protein